MVTPADDKVKQLSEGGRLEKDGLPVYLTVL